MLEFLVLTTRILAGVSAICLGVTFTQYQRTRHPVLHRLDDAQIWLFLSAILLLIVSESLSSWKDEREQSQKRKEATERHATLLAAMAGYPSIPRPEKPKTLDEAMTQSLEAAVSMAITAEQHFASGKYQQAIEGYKDADRISELAVIKARIADAYFAINDYERVIEFEDEAIALLPDWSGPHYMKAEALRRLGRESEAIAPARRSCELGFLGACELAEDLESSIN